MNAIFAPALNRFAPIECGKVLPTHHSLLVTEALQSPRAQPDYEGADDIGLYSETTSARPLLIDALGKLPNQRLVDLGWELRSRLLKGEFGAPDFAVLTALIERVEAAK